MEAATWLRNDRFDSVQQTKLVVDADSQHESSPEKEGGSAARRKNFTHPA
jgi:hypothetical protein